VSDFALPLANPCFPAPFSQSNILAFWQTTSSTKIWTAAFTKHTKAKLKNKPLAGNFGLKPDEPHRRESLFAPFPQLARLVCSQGALKGELILRIRNMRHISKAFACLNRKKSAPRTSTSPLSPTGVIDVDHFLKRTAAQKNSRKRWTCLF
jgi:hypothetical protein